MKWLARLLILVLAACSSAPVPSPMTSTAAAESGRTWPPAPAPPRIRLEYAFSGPEDLGIRSSAFSKLWDTLAGARDTGMVRPYAVAVKARKILIGDPGAHAVYLYDRDRGTSLRIVRAGDEMLQSPVGVALGDERIFVADSALGKVYTFNTRGRLLATLEGLQRPTGLAFDPETGQLYVAETLAHRIIVFDADGARLFAFGQRGIKDGEFNYPSHLSLSDGRLLVNDNMNFRIQVFDTAGRHLKSFGEHGDGSGYFSQPKGVAADERGRVFVAGATIDRVQIFSPDGRFLLAFGDGGEGPGQFVMPAGLASDGNYIYVADSYNRRIQVFRYVGKE